MSTEQPLPPLQLAVRTDQGCQLYCGPPSVQPQQNTSVPSSQILYSSDGRLLVNAHHAGIDVYNSFTFEKEVGLNTAGIAYLDISPSGRYLSTFEKSPKDEAEFKNLKVWDLTNVQNGPMIAHRVKNVNQETWPVFQFSQDEQTLIHLGPNTLNILSVQDNFKQPIRKLAQKGIGCCALSPSDEAPFVGLFVPGAKGAAASAQIYHIPSLPASTSEAQPPSVARRSMFRTQGMRLYWNRKGSSLLIVAYQDVDASNQSYYGEQKLHFLSSDSRIEQQVPNLKEGPIHDVQWSPQGTHFVVVCGFMPAKTFIFDDKCKPLYDLGSGPVNTIRWNPQGRFFAVAGFGNLPGDITFYDKKVSGKCVHMGKVRSPSVDCSWSPCGRYLMTKVVAPRLRVDNAFKVFTYFGESVHEEQFPVLLDVRWRPAAEDVFPDLPAVNEDVKLQQQQSKEEASTSGSYVPPHLRNKMGGGSSLGNEQFSLAHDPDDVPGKVKKIFADRLNAPSKVPGEEFVSKSSRNARKRQNKKKNAQESQDQSGTQQVDSIDSGRGATSSSNQHQNQDVDVEKRLKNLQKKYRQIQQLKQRRATEGQASLEPEQIAKIATEKDIIAEIQSLGGSI